MTIFSTDKDFLAGWDDYYLGNTAPSSKIISDQMWQDGWDAAKVYFLQGQEEEEMLMELPD